jgi:hypothetical protein
VREHPEWKGVQGVAKLAESLDDRQNLSQCSYLHLLSRCETTIKTERKAQFFINLLESHPREALSWLTLGREPYLERRLQNYYTLNQKFARDLVHGFRNRFDTFLPEVYKLRQIIPVISAAELELAANSFFDTIIEYFNTLESLSVNQKMYVNKIQLFRSRLTAICEFIVQYLTKWHQPTQSDKIPTSFWKLLKQLSPALRDFLKQTYGIKRYRRKDAYFSLLRNIVITAFVPYFQIENTQQSIVTELIVSQQLIPEHIVTPPYEKTRLKSPFYHRVPLTLNMGALYVLRRQGSKQKITKHALEHGTIPLLIKPDDRRIPWKQAIPCEIRVHKRIRSFLERDAVINMLVLYAGNAPQHKIRVQLILSGQYQYFLSEKAIRQLQSFLPQFQAIIEALGLDINRIGEYMLAFSEQIPLPDELLLLCKRYKARESDIRRLSKLVTKATELLEQADTEFARRNLCKRQTELRFIYERRERLLSEVHRYCSRLVSAVLLQTQSPVLCVEELSCSTYRTRGALAKAIISMPDAEDIYTRSAMTVQWLTGNPIKVIEVDARNTSRSPHLTCWVTPKGKIQRSSTYYDLVPCSACGLMINTHHHAACVIRNRGLEFLALEPDLIQDQDQDPP